jgi:hypothetical protein
VELNGINPGTGYDQIAVSGPIVLGGALSLALGFSPPIGTTFNIISNSGAGAVNGTFAGLPEGATQLVGGTTLKISYVGGDGNDVTLTAIAGATSTVVVPLPNPSVFGQAVTLTATVTGAAPTGTVQFMDGAVDMGAPVPLVSGQAMFVTSTLIAGGHPITAVYSGDAGNLPSTSPVVTQMVNPAATSMAITSALPAVLNAGQSVTVSVVVTANAPGAGTPTGTVAVQDGASPLCTVTLAVRRSIRQARTR